MLPGQLDLFGSTTLPSTGLVGVQARLSSACHCGCDIIPIGSSNAPHSAAITCNRCHKHRGWLSRAEHERISAIVNESGRAEPIDIGGKR